MLVFPKQIRSNTSSGKSSSIRTTSTARSSLTNADLHIGVPAHVAPLVSATSAETSYAGKSSLSFAQQLQQQAHRGSRLRTGQLPPLPPVLSPLNEPQSPLYSSPPPPSPPLKVSINFPTDSAYGNDLFTYNVQNVVLV